MSDTYVKDEDFFNALTLLHSTDENSAEKLRRMLDVCIEKRYGPDKTLVARMPRRFLQNIDANANASMRISKKRDYAKTIKNEIWNDSKVISLLEFDATENNIANNDHRSADIKVLENNYEDCCDDQNVPRISIPDEGPVDGTVCKICNGAKLGPLIVLECQECQEAYHPLCHQPPIVDVDVYDPRFVWRCRRCVETSSAISTKVRILENGSVEKKIRRNNDDTIKENANISRLKMSERKDGDLSEENDTSRERSNIYSPAKNRSVQLRDSLLFTKDLANLSQRNGCLSFFTQSRKRIGSKLSVIRTIK